MSGLLGNNSLVLFQGASITDAERDRNDPNSLGWGLGTDGSKMGAWREDLDPKIQVVWRLAREFNALYIPLDGIFAKVCAVREPAFWAAMVCIPPLPGTPSSQDTDFKRWENG